MEISSSENHVDWSLAIYALWPGCACQPEAEKAACNVLMYYMLSIRRLTRSSRARCSCLLASLVNPG